MSELSYSDLRSDERLAMELLRAGFAPNLTAEMADRLKSKGLARAGLGGTVISAAGRSLMARKLASIIHLNFHREP